MDSTSKNFCLDLFFSNFVIKDLRSLAERTGWVSTDNRFLLHEEILLLKQKLYHVYDDLATLFNRNHSLEISSGEQKQQLQYKY
jgi:hypothetical protein